MKLGANRARNRITCRTSRCACASRQAAAGFAALEDIPSSRVANYQPYWAARGHLLQLLKQKDEAQKAFTRAAA